MFDLPDEPRLKALLHEFDLPFNLQQRLTGEGARFEEAEPRADHAVRDGRLVTGQNPWSSASVAQLLVDAVEQLGADSDH